MPVAVVPRTQTGTPGLIAEVVALRHSSHCVHTRVSIELRLASNVLLNVRIANEMIVAIESIVAKRTFFQSIAYRL
jgi:hypothetical protein